MHTIFLSRTLERRHSARGNADSDFIKILLPFPLTIHGWRSLSIQRRIIVIMLFPVIIFLWLLGWSLYWIADENRSRRKMQSLDDGISIVAGLYEEAVITSRD